MFRWLLSWWRWLWSETPPRPRPPARRPLSGFESLEDRNSPGLLPVGLLDLPFAVGLTNPTSMEFSPDGRVFVAEKAGRLRVVRGGALLPAPFLSLAVDTFSERGLVGVALDPRFAQNGFVYVYYTTAGPGPVNRLSRFTVSSANPDTADPNSEVMLIDGIPSPSGRHNGGALRFGADGMLYVGVGDGGQARRAQRLGSLSGKILRLDVANVANLVPADNPFVGRRRARPEVWALGFRNPFTIAAAPGADALLVNDVGEATFEEINLVRRGRNYGWPIFEGPGKRAGLFGPLHAYAHRNRGAAITGAVVYDRDAIPGLRGSYLFGDYLEGFIRRIPPGRSRAVNFARGAASPVDLDIGPDGFVYYLSIGEGAVRVIRPG